MNREIQRRVYNHLKMVCETQLKVRNCEIEGRVFDLESDLETVSCLGLITFKQEEDLLAILNKEN
jgi:hypothetical protein